MLEWIFGLKKFDLIAPFYDWAMTKVERKTLAPLRREYVKMIEGRVLDLAVGTGHNLEYYPMDKVSDVTMIDLSKGMLAKTREKIEKRNSDYHRFNVVEAPCEQLPFDADTFDWVLSIDVMCSVDDQKKTLDEAYRVLKPNGRAVFVEHFRTGYFWQDLYLSLLTLLTYPLIGASMVRDTGGSIKNSQFVVEETGQVGVTEFTYFVCRKDLQIYQPTQTITMSCHNMTCFNKNPYSSNCVVN